MLLVLFENIGRENKKCKTFVKRRAVDDKILKTYVIFLLLLSSISSTALNFKMMQEFGNTAFQFLEFSVIKNHLNRKSY